MGPDLARAACLALIGLLVVPAGLAQGLPPTSAAAEPKATPIDPVDPIAVAPLAAPDPQATGILPARAAGLPADLWARSDPARLVDLLDRVPTGILPAGQALFRRLLLIEATPPATDHDRQLLTARIRTLLRLGEVEAAKSLIERAGPDQPDLFRLWFDTLLLTGSEDRGCATLQAKPELAPDYATRIFCLARTGRWTTAALTLGTATALNALDDGTQDRLARFLDPDLFEDGQPAAVPDPVTPLDYRLLEAIGEPLPLTGLPLSYAQSDLRHIVGWKAQIEAAERLARAGSLDPNVLLGIYTARRPAASGGVWDRVALMQRLDVALSSASIAGIGAYLPVTRAAMTQAGLYPVLARMVAPRLGRIDVQGDAALVAYELALVSNETAAFRPPPDGLALSPRQAALAALAQNRPLPAAAPAIAQSMATGLTAKGVADADRAALADGRLGEALLRALIALEPDGEADADDVADALRVLRAAGLHSTARHAALQYLSLSAP